MPPEIEGLQLVASVSGGKDSTAMLLALREAGIPHRAVFADTGWEAPETYEYLDLLRERLGIKIDVVQNSSMVERVRHRAGFPARMQRWCTRELKLQPLRAYHDALEVDGEETVAIMGVRAAESAARSDLPELADEPAGDRSWGGWVWRPLLRWSVEDVLATHRRHGVPVNPLYLRGHDRVGCYPCIYARKEEIRLVAEHAPRRIDEIRALENEVVQLRRRRNVEKPGRYKQEDCSYFQRAQIDDVVAWSRTAHGGKELLLDPVPTGGCMRWGLCETAEEKIVEVPTITTPHKHHFVGKPSSCIECNVLKSDCWRTPLDHLERVFRMLGDVDLDPCADRNLDHQFALESLWRGGLEAAWLPMRVFMNPPYSEASKWVEKAWKSGSPVLGLVHVSTASRYWHKFIWGCAQRICFVHGRIQFLDPETGEPATANRYDSAYVLWNATPEQRKRFDTEYSKIGWLPK